jgi:alkylation response protein AidB-like acyl-CoA dehydrogenase
MPATTNAILEAAKAMAPAITKRGDEIEQGRRLPPDLVDELIAAGCFRMLVPRSHGGAELAVTAQLDVLGELSRADGSVGWTVMIGCSAPIILGLLPRETFDAIYAGGPDVVLSAVFNPTGTATPVDGGFLVSGRWAFASGCQHAHWFSGHCLVDDGRMPPVRMMVMPPAEVGIVDTWSAAGLCGTGSHDVVADAVFVPDERTFELGGEPAVDVPLARIPELSLSTLLLAGVAVGVARGALDEIMALATAKTPAFSDTTLAANPLFQNQLGEADTLLRAARSLLYTEAGSAWAMAGAGTPFTPEDRGRIRGATTWVARAAAEVVDMAYRAGGGTAIYTSSPLQRRLRDIRTLTQHFALKPDTFTKAGAVLAGQETDLTFL